MPDSPAFHLEGRSSDFCLTKLKTPVGSKRGCLDLRLKALNELVRLVQVDLEGPQVQGPISTEVGSPRNVGDL